MEKKRKKRKGASQRCRNRRPSQPPLGLFPPLTRPNPSPGRTRVPSPFFLSPTDSWAPPLLSLRRGTRASAPLSFFPQPSSNRTRDPRHRILPNPDLGGICLPRAPIKSLDRLRVAPFPSAPQKRSPRSLARRGVESAEAASIPHRGASSQSPLGPSNDPRRLRGELLDLPAFSVQRKVLGVGRTTSSVELGPSGHGATTPEANPCGRPLPASLWPDLGRPFEDRRPGNENTPSRAQIVKETLGFSQIEPAVQHAFQLYVF